MFVQEMEIVYHLKHAIASTPVSISETIAKPQYVFQKMHQTRQYVHPMGNVFHQTNASVKLNPQKPTAITQIKITYCFYW
jgi:hypothetical protein